MVTSSSVAAAHAAAAASQPTNSPQPTPSSIPNSMEVDSKESQRPSTDSIMESSDSHDTSPSSDLSEDIEMGDFQVVSHKKASSGSKPSKDKKHPPNTLFVDFIPNIMSPHLRIRHVLQAYTHFASSVDFYPLERGGVACRFKSESQRRLGEKIIKEKLQDILLPKKSWLDDKEVFEICIKGIRRSFNLELLNHIPGVHSHRLIYKTVEGNKRLSCAVLLCESAEIASKYIKEGLDISGYFFNPSIWINRPKISCSQCGSLDHKECQVHICLRCGWNHSPDTTPCNDKARRCGRCFDHNHTSFQCPAYKSKLKDAIRSKKKSYAEALQVSTPGQSPSAVKESSHSRPRESKPRYVDLVSPTKQPDVSKIILTCITILGQLFNLNITEKLDEIQTAIQNSLQESLSTPPTQQTSTQAPVSNVTPDISAEDPASRDVEILEPILEPSQESSSKKQKLNDSSAKKASSNSSKPSVHCNCSCGKAYNTNPGWRVHLKACDGTVICPCGSFKASRGTTPSNWIQFNHHLLACTPRNQ